MMSPPLVLLSLLAAAGGAGSVYLRILMATKIFLTATLPHVLVRNHGKVAGVVVCARVVHSLTNESMNSEKV